MLQLVIPIYDEAHCLEKALEAARQALDATGEPWQLVCVDDGSSDGSREILERAAADDRLLLVRHEDNRGKGAALRSGLADCAGDFVFFADADQSTPFSEIGPALELLRNGADVAAGTRRHADSQISARQPMVRELMGMAFTNLARMVTGHRGRDFTCGFKGFRGDAARSIFSSMRLDGWAFDAELFLIARVRGYSVMEHPVPWSHDPHSKVRPLANAVASLCDLGRLAALRMAGRYRSSD